MAKKRITELTEATSVKSDHYIPVDHGTDGTQKMSMSTLIDSTLTTSGKAADAKATGDEIADVKQDLNRATKTFIPLIDWRNGTVFNWNNASAISTHYIIDTRIMKGITIVLRFNIPSGYKYGVEFTTYSVSEGSCSEELANKIRKEQYIMSAEGLFYIPLAESEHGIAFALWADTGTQTSPLRVATTDTSLIGVALHPDDSLIDSDELPYYWQNYLDNKVESINSKISDIGFRGDSFFFMTDMHWPSNEKHSPAIIRYLKGKTPTKRVIQGGDILNQHASRATALQILENYMASTSDLNVINIVGNHDDNSNGQTSATALFVGAGAFYRLLNSQTEDFVSWADGKNYGYFDNEVQKIRHIYLDTGTPDMHIFEQEQIDWFSARVAELSSEWTVIVFAHMLFTPRTSDYDSLVMNNNGWRVASTINTIMGYATHPHIACVISGHTHRDFSLNDPYENGYPIICTTCDAGSLSEDDPNTQYVANTVTAQAIDIFCVNTTSKAIDAVRIGNGSDRNWSYSN